MLDGAFTSPKLRRLSVILGVPWPHAIGLAGLLWRFAAKHAPTGEIGRHDDEEVAAALEWAGEADELIAALVRCRLLDRVNGPARLIVHDWPDHAPRYVQATLRRRDLFWSHHYEQQGEQRHEQNEQGEHTIEGTVDETVVGTVEQSVVETTSSSSSSSTLTSSSPSTYTSKMTRMVEAIWDSYVPGKKTGKAEAFKAIRNSIEKISSEFKVSVEDAAREILLRTRRDAERYREQLRNGETEIEFIPFGVSYFRKERWLDDDDEPEATPTRGDLADRDLKRIRGT